MDQTRLKMDQKGLELCNCFKIPFVAQTLFAEHMLSEETIRNEVRFGESPTLDFALTALSSYCRNFRGWRLQTTYFTNFTRFIVVLQRYSESQVSCRSDCLTCPDLRCWSGSSDAMIPLFRSFFTSVLICFSPINKNLFGHHILWIYNVCDIFK